MFRRYSPYVAAIASRVLGRGDDVDDVIQEVFLAAVTGMRLRDRDAVKSWLATVTVRTSRRMLRLRSRCPTPDDLSCDEIAGPSLGQEQAVTLARVRAVLEEMPAEIRGAWVRRYVGGELLGAVAASCGCSLATAKRRISAAQGSIGRALTNG